MDPVSVFNALYDTKCLKFGRYDLKSGLVAPYYMNLRRLPLYPALMDAVVTQVYERFLSPQAVAVTMSQVRRRRELRSMSTGSQVMESISKELKEVKKLISKEPGPVRDKKPAATLSDSDSQLGDEETSSDDWEEANETMLDSASYQCPIISGVPYGAIPLAAAIAYKSRLPFLFERKEAKAHGDHQPLLEDFRDETSSGRKLDKRTHGLAASEDDDDDDDRQPQQEQSVILIEDVICSGESILEAAERLEKQKLRVEFVICLVDREENGTNLLLQNAGIRVLSLYKISAILRVLEATGRITNKQFVEIRQWISDNQFRTIGVNPALGSIQETAQVGKNNENNDKQKQQHTSIPIEIATN